MGFILLLGIIGVIAWAMSWRPGDAREPAIVAQPGAEDVGPSRAMNQASAQRWPDPWTALDEHQLNRLLNEPT